MEQPDFLPETQDWMLAVNVYIYFSELHFRGHTYFGEKVNQR